MRRTPTRFIDYTELPDGSVKVEGGKLVNDPDGGASTVYKRRDRLTATAGNNTLTLGATPVADSPLVWVNGTITWPGVDYTISDNVITFTTGLSAGAVVAVIYDTPNPSPGAATLTSPGAISDDFNRADSTTSLGTTSTGGVAWVALVGTWGINGNRAYPATPVAAQGNYAVIDSGFADGTVKFTVAAIPPAPAEYFGVCFRVTDANNLYVLEAGGGATNARLYKRVAGTYTVIGTAATTNAFAVGDVVEVVLAGSAITCKRNGATFLTVTDATYTTQTRHGFYTAGDDGVRPKSLRFDDFSVTP